MYDFEYIWSAIVCFWLKYSLQFQFFVMKMLYCYRKISGTVTAVFDYKKTTK